MRFLALDFETANYQRNSACALGLVLVDGTSIIEEKYYLIRPLQKEFTFTYIHGITWSDVKNEPTFRELYPEIQGYFKKINFAAAHNASFDKSVLNKCCEHYKLSIPKVPFECTVKLSKEVWGLRYASLPVVCKHFRIPLTHHNAMSDTLACAKIMIKVIKSGYYND